MGCPEAEGEKEKELIKLLENNILNFSISGEKAFLFNEKITTSFKFERYALIQSLYKPTFQYTENIKPASDPRYTLDKFFGNMTINEYRQLNKSYNNFMVIDKPITISLPEIYESNNNIHIINTLMQYV